MERRRGEGVNLEELREEEMKAGEGRRQATLLTHRRETKAKLLGLAKVSGSRLSNMTKDGGGGSWRWESQVAF